jgi:methylmalonyl-CoA/ethylmalonyl-CoA epimerase
MIKKVHHVAIAVKDLKKALSVYTDLFGLTSRVQDLGEYDLRIGFVEVGEVLIEFLQPTSEGDPLGFSAFLKEHGEGLHHIAYEVDDIEKTLARLRENGIRMRDQRPKRGADGMIAFAEKEGMAGVLVEFVERPKG